MNSTGRGKRTGKSRLQGPSLGRYLKASAILGAAASPASVLANFSGDYSVTDPSHPPGTYTTPSGPFGNWNASVVGSSSFTSLNTTGAPNQIALTDNQFDIGSTDFKFLVTAAATGLLSFNYAVSASHDSDGNANAFFIDQTTSTKITLTGSNTFSGSVAVGDIFGFEVSAGYIGDVTLTINNFSAPEPAPSGVPDNASTLAMLAFGFLGLLTFRAKSRRANVIS